MDVHYQPLLDHSDDNNHDSNNNNSNNNHNHNHNHNRNNNNDPRSRGLLLLTEPDLWDELNDQQSREVQQHQSRFQPPTLASRTHPTNILVSMAQSTVHRVGESAKSAWVAAQQAWNQYPQQQQHHHQNYHQYHSYGNGSYGNSNTTSTEMLYPAWTQYPRSARRNNAIHDLDQEFGLQDLRPPSPFQLRTAEEQQQTTTKTSSTTTTSNNNTATSTATNSPRNNNPFVILSNFPRHVISTDPRDHWGMVANIDVFLTHLYQYYYHRGLLPMICKFIVELISLLFTLWLSLILLQKVNWKKLTTCKDEMTCMANWSDYYYNNNNNKNNNNDDENYDYDNNNNDDTIGWLHWFLVQGYAWLFLGYAAFSVWTFWQSLQHAIMCQTILHDKLGISKRKLQGGAVAWDTVVTKLMEAQESGDYQWTLPTPNHNNNNNQNDNTANTTGGAGSTNNGSRNVINSHSYKLDALTIAQRIMRKENFLIAFWNQPNLLLECTRIGGRHYWCPSLEWCLHLCVLNFMFNHKYEIRPAFYLDAASLQRRLLVCGIAHAILLPFLIIFVLLHFLLRNVYDFKTTRQYMGNKQWSSVAQWTFREFNELPHVLEQRLEPSYHAAESYIKLFGTSEWIAAIGKLFVFLGGAVGGVIFVLGVMNDAILLHVQLWGRNLLWYGGMAGIVYSVGKALLPTKESQPSVSRNLFADMDAALKNVSTHTHYYPEVWKGRGWDASVYKAFGKFFDSKVKLFIWEVISLLLAPYILIARLSPRATEICEFCLAIKTRVPGSGDVCGYSSFDFDTFADEAWEGRTLGKSVMVGSPGGDNGDNDDTLYPRGTTETLSQSILRTGNVEDATRRHPKPKAREGKMEKSFFSFQAAHPSWKCSPSGQSLVDRVEEYRKAELAAITRERGLYIEAAARQLETLAKLEQLQQQQISPNPTKRFQQELLQDSYIPRVATAAAAATVAAATADAGAGAGSHHSYLYSSSPFGHPAPSFSAAAAASSLVMPSLLHSAHSFHHQQQQQQEYYQQQQQQHRQQQFEQNHQTQMQPQQQQSTTARPQTVSFARDNVIPEEHHHHRQQQQRMQQPEENSKEKMTKNEILQDSSSKIPPPLPQLRPLQPIITTSSSDSIIMNNDGTFSLDVDDDDNSNNDNNNNSNHHNSHHHHHHNNTTITSLSESRRSGVVPQIGLSTELRRILDMSSLHAGESVLQESTPNIVTTMAAAVATPPPHHHHSLQQQQQRQQQQNMTPTRTEQQYYWLERFHEHLERQRQHEEMVGGNGSVGTSAANNNGNNNNDTSTFSAVDQSSLSLPTMTGFSLSAAAATITTTATNSNSNSNSNGNNNHNNNHNGNENNHYHYYQQQQQQQEPIISRSLPTHLESVTTTTTTTASSMNTNDIHSNNNTNNDNNNNHSSSSVV